MIISMPSLKDDTAFLRQCLQARREFYGVSDHLCYPQDFGEVTNESSAKYEAEMRRIVRLADTYGTKEEADFLRDYLLRGPEDNDNPVSLSAIRRLEKEIKMLDRILTRMEQTHSPEQGKSTTPTDLISSAVAVNDYSVSRATLRRAVAEKRLRDYRPKGHVPNAPLRLSRAEVANIWPKRGQ